MNANEDSNAEMKEKSESLSYKETKTIIGCILAATLLATIPILIILLKGIEEIPI